MTGRLPVPTAVLLTVCMVLSGCGKRIPVTSDPPGADIYLNEKPTGLKTPAELDLTRQFVSQTVDLKLPGYREERAYAETVGNSFYGICAAPCGFCAWSLIGDANGPPPDSIQGKTASFMVYLYSFSQGSILADRISLTLQPDTIKKDSEIRLP